VSIFEYLQALVPIVTEVTVPFEYHGQLIGQKGKEIRQIMDECEVTITIPKPEDHSNIIKISGPPGKIPHAEEVIKNRVQRLEEDRRQRVRYFQDYLL
jgi:polyribonucleotide nucleotidyltransferase